MKQISVGIIGTGWCGGIRAEPCAPNALVKDLHVVETRPELVGAIHREYIAAGAEAIENAVRLIVVVTERIPRQRGYRPAGIATATYGFGENSALRSQT